MFSDANPHENSQEPVEATIEPVRPHVLSHVDRRLPHELRKQLTADLSRGQNEVGIRHDLYTRYELRRRFGISRSSFRTWADRTLCGLSRNACRRRVETTKPADAAEPVAGPVDGGPVALESRSRILDEAVGAILLRELPGLFRDAEAPADVARLLNAYANLHRAHLMRGRWRPENSPASGFDRQREPATARAGRSRAIGPGDPRVEAPYGRKADGTAYTREEFREALRTSLRDVYGLDFEESPRGRTEEAGEAERARFGGPGLARDEGHEIGQ